jgi:ankyrin repeat protein
MKTRLLINERAFAPASMPPVQADFCSILYPGEAPEYGLTLPLGTVQTLEEFTFEERSIIDTLNHQFSLLLENITKQCGELDIKDKDLFENIETLEARYTARTYYASEPARFYAQIKQSLEAVAYHLSHNALLNNDEKKRIMEDLLKWVHGCSGGVFQHIQIAKNNLSTHETIDAWLARFRVTLIQQAAGEYARRSIGYHANEIHAETVFLKYADEQDWAPYGVETRPAVKDTFAHVAKIKPEDLENFRNDFLQRYNPVAIMTELATRLHDSILTRLQKKRSEQQANDEKQEGIVIQGSSAFENFFSGIPLNEKGLGTLDVFDVAQDKNPASFCYTDQWYSLKSVPQLMLSMTSAFAREGTNIFETYQDKYYTLVKDSPELCYQHSEETPSIDAAKHAVKWMQENLTRLTSLLFHSFYQSGVRDFSCCMLYRVDFSGYNIEELILENTPVYLPSKMTPEQFITLFNKNVILSSLHLDIEKIEPFDFNEQSLLEFLPPDQEILFFYAVFFNNPAMIELLLEKNIDVSKRLIEEKTAITHAIELERWECIIKFMEKGEITSKAISAYIASVGMLTAAKNNRFDIAEVFLNLGADINFCDFDKDEVTALGYAARHKNSAAISVLLSKGADTKRRSRVHTTAIEISILLRDWQSLQVFFAAEKIIQQEIEVTVSTRGLFAAILEDRLDMVKILLHAGATIDFNSIGIANLFDDPNNPDIAMHGKIVLLQLTQNIELILVLLEKFIFTTRLWNPIADFFHGKENCSRLLLPYAARDNQLNAVKQLLERFPDIINARDLVGHTALVHAAVHGHEEMVRFLLNNNADTTIGRPIAQMHIFTPLLAAVNNKEWKCAQLLISKDSGLFSGNLIILAVKDNQYDIVKELLSEKISIDLGYCFDKKRSALYFAIEQNNIDMVRLLLTAGKRNGFSRLININKTIPKNEIDLAILLLDQIQAYNFSPEINKCFLNFYQVLTNDDTSDKTKAIVLQHFIDILRSHEDKEEPNEDKNQRNLLIIEKILNSEQDLKNKLNGKPPMSLSLKIALGAFFGGLVVIAVTCVMIYLGIGIGAAAGTVVGKLIPSFLMGATLGGPFVGYFASFSNSAYSKKKTRNNGIVDTMLEPLRPPPPS